MIFTEKNKEKYVKWKINKEGNPLEKVIDIFSENFNKNIYYNPISTFKQFILDSPFISEKIICEFKLEPFRLSKNRFLSEEIIKSRIDEKWDWESLSQNNLSCKFILENLDKNFNWAYICMFNKNIMELVENLQEKYKDRTGIFCLFDWKLISINPNITPDFIEKHLDKPLDWSYLSSNKFITSEFIEKYINRLDIERLSDNQNLNFSIVQKYKNLNWKWDAIISLSSVKISDIKEHIPKPWDFTQLCYNPNVDLNFIEKYKKDIEDWNAVVTQTVYIKELIAKKEVLIKPAWSRQYPFEKWENRFWSLLSDNINLTEDIIEEYINKNWHWHSISSNPNLTLSFIEKWKNNFSDYDVRDLLRNNFYTTNIGFKNSIKKDIKKRRIQTENILQNLYAVASCIIIYICY